MPNPTTLSAGIVPVRIIDGEPHLLILRCFNYWDFPKGEVEPGEDPRATAQREFGEETGLGAPLWPQQDRADEQGTATGEIPYIETEPYARGKVARYYIARAPDGNVTLPISPELGYPEHHEYRWVTFAEADRLFNPRLRRVLAWARAQIDSAGLETGRPLGR